MNEWDEGPLAGEGGAVDLRWAGVFDHLDGEFASINRNSGAACPFEGREAMIIPDYKLHVLQDRAVFAGNVVVRQGNLTLRTPRLTLAYSNQGGLDIDRIDASGGVVVTSPSETARGDFAVYNPDEGLITMVGNVRLERGGSYLNGARLTIDLDTGRAVMDGGLRGVNQSGGGRVTGRFSVPQRNTPPAQAPAPKQ